MTAHCPRRGPVRTLSPETREPHRLAEPPGRLPMRKLLARSLVLAAGPGPSSPRGRPRRRGRSRSACSCRKPVRSPPTARTWPTASSSSSRSRGTAGRPRGEAHHRGRRGQAGHRARQGAEPRGEPGVPRAHGAALRRDRLRRRALPRREEDADHLPHRLRRGHHPAQAQPLHRPHRLVERPAVAPVRQVGLRQPRLQEDRDDRLRLRVRLGGRGRLPAHLRGGGRPGRAEALAAARDRGLRALPGPAPPRRGRDLLRCSPAPTRSASPSSSTKPGSRAACRSSAAAPSPTSTCCAPWATRCWASSPRSTTRRRSRRPPTASSPRPTRPSSSRSRRTTRRAPTWPASR